MKILAFLLLFFSASFAPVFAQGQVADQEMQGFSLSGFSDKGKKSWNVRGSFANIFSDAVYLDNITADMYGDNDNLCLVADKGKYDKDKAIIYLKDNVVATTQSGARLKTDSLDWLQDAKLVRTDDRVEIDKENILTTAKGLRAKPDLKRIRLMQQARVDIREFDSSLKPKDVSDTKVKADTGSGDLTTITCDGVLELDYDREIAVFNKNVCVINKDGKINSDRLKVYFDFKNKKMVNIIATGNVKIVRDGNISYSKKAVYTTQSQTLELTGRPKIVIFSKDSLKGLSDASIRN